MRKRVLWGIFVALFVVSVPAMAVFTGMDLDVTLSNLRCELYHDYKKIDDTQEQLRNSYEVQHHKMVDIVKKCNDLSLMLYSQKQDYTFDISYALEKVGREYSDFNKNRTPYDRIMANLDIEIGRYARLIESLRRLPPEIKDLEVVPDSLAYHNDTLDAHLQHNASLLQQEFHDQAHAAMSIPAFTLSERGSRDRDSCILYASELLKMHAQARNEVMADSTHYREARLRMDESYQYTEEYYDIIENKVFKEGQTPWRYILANPAEYWSEVRRTMGEKYNKSFIQQAFEEEQMDYSTEEIINDSQLSNSAKVFWLSIYLVAFFVLWGIAALLMMLVYRFVKPVGRWVAKEQKPYLALLLGCVLFLGLSYESTSDDITRKAMVILHTFIWLLMAINTALLVRLKASRIKGSMRIYMPTILTALFVISCRVLFVPNAFLNFFLPPLLLVMTLWQLVANLRMHSKADQTDMVVGWVSLGVSAVAMGIGWAGYIFLALIILAWWYFQLATILGIASIWDLALLYKENRLNKRLASYKAKITYVTGPAKEQLLFKATWFYDLVHDVLIPVMVIGSIPACVYWALDIFEFNDLFNQIFLKPFFHQGGPDGFRISLYTLLLLVALLYIFKYLNKAIHVIWQSLKYRRFLRKYNRKTVRSNEINLQLGNSLISVFIWFIYADIAVIVLNIPTGSLGLIAGGLSAGIGLALKDILNNFIYGIQLMGGRLRVGDWIECDGIRGKVTDISYQTTMVETLQGTQVAFLNSALFGKSFTNLTKNNSYELTIVKVGVAYGTDFEKVRLALEKGLQVLKRKDPYGRDVVEPNYGFYIRFDDFGESSVNVAVRQYVLVPEQIEYVYQCKELIYKILKENGITIPFPQRDVHMIPPEK